MSPALTEIASYCINLDRAVERWEQMSGRIAALGIPVSRFSAIDGKQNPSEVSKSLDAASFSRNMGRDALPAEVACYLSHLSVWQDFLKGEREYCLVLEDDVVFHDDFLEALEAGLETRDSWDMLKLNRIRAKLPLRQGTVGNYTLNSYLGPATGFGAYLITRELAERLLPKMLPVRMPIDYEATRFWAHNFRLMGLEPWPSHVDDGGVSTITGHNFSEVRKRPRLQRLGNLAMRAGNYFRRASWFFRNGNLIGSKQSLGTSK